jgi:hypothetical protein
MKVKLFSDGETLRTDPPVPFRLLLDGGTALVAGDDGVSRLHTFTAPIFVYDAPDGVVELIEFVLPGQDEATP